MAYHQFESRLVGFKNSEGEWISGQKSHDNQQKIRAANRMIDRQTWNAKNGKGIKKEKILSI
jgi:hypothetical protein